MAETMEMCERMSKPWLMMSSDDSRKPCARDKVEAGSMCRDSLLGRSCPAARLQLWLSP